jgi:hypothetical protein
MQPSQEPESRLFRPEESVPFESLCIRLPKCLNVQPGAILAATLSDLDRKSYEQAPVYDPATKTLWGLADTDYLKALHTAGTPLGENDPHVRDEEKILRVGTSGNIYQLLDRLRKQRAIIVIQESDSTEYGLAEFILGLFTISDLNRHAIRAILYRLLSDAEARLAYLIEKEFDDPWEWLSLLPEEHQVRVLGYWELSKRRLVDIGPVEALTLTQLLTIVAKFERLRERLGFKKRKELDGEIGRVPEFRNRIMHPVRPLILDMEDVNRAYAVARFLEKVRDSLASEEKRGID